MATPRPTQPNHAHPPSAGWGQPAQATSQASRTLTAFVALLALCSLLLFTIALFRSAMEPRRAPPAQLAKPTSTPSRTKATATVQMTRKPKQVIAAQPTRTPQPTPTRTKQLAQASPVITPVVTEVATVVPVLFDVAPVTTTRIEPWALVQQLSDLRQLPSPAAETAGQVPNGAHVQILAWAGEWWLVRGEQSTGWIGKAALVVDPEAIAYVPFAVDVVPQLAGAVIQQTGALRLTPSASAAAVAAIEPGDVLMVLSKAGEWWQLRSARHAGWFQASLATLHPAGAQVVPNYVAPAPSPRPKQATAVPLPTPAPVPPPANRTLPVKPAPATSWPLGDGPGNLVRLVGVRAPQPYLAPGAVAAFNRARSRILNASGVDYLSQLGDAFRSIDFNTSKPGVANRSWHKAGRAIDVAQYFAVGGRQGVVFVPDRANRGLWRVLVRCARQNGNLGTWYGPKALQGRGAAAYYVDVTTILLAEGWLRIYGYEGVSEAWHYEYHGGLSWRSAMLQLYPKRTVNAWFP